MENLDLDINNYSLVELFDLFKINNELNDENMKKAKNIVYKMHPDKSRLDSKYFLFFSKAYKKLYQIYEFQNKSSNKKGEEEYSIKQSDKDELLNQFIKKNNLEDKTNFQKWFNNEFEKQNGKSLDDGYEDWFKSNNGIIDENVQGSSINEKINNYKKQAVTQYNGEINGLNSGFGSGLILAQESNFSSPMFSSNLGYNDLKEAYENTIFDISDDIQKPKYTLNEYKSLRDNQNLKPKTNEESDQYFQDQSRLEEEESIQTAYRLTKEYEENKSKNKKFWQKMQQITNS